MSDIAQYDQLLSQARLELSVLRQTTANLQSKHGDVQGLADVMAMLSRWPRDRIISALAAALTEGSSTDVHL